MVEIEDVIIISIDKNDNSWEIEGEIIFESNLTCPFSVDYDSHEDELVDVQLEMNPGKYDKSALKAMILKSAMEYED